MVRTRYGSLGILGHSLRNKIPIVGKQGERELAHFQGKSTGGGRTSVTNTVEIEVSPYCDEDAAK
jgi:hypothetical protein